MDGIKKSRRHAKIAGDFGELLTLYLLSKHGYECIRADYIGIDIIAQRKDKRLGISVKSRTRTPGKETESISIPHDSIQKAKAACATFGCVPHFAIVADAGNKIRVFVVPLETLLRLLPRRKATRQWKMTYDALQHYKELKLPIKIVEFTTRIIKW